MSWRCGWPRATRAFRGTPRRVAAAVAAYALSPIDLIPDFVPVLGYLDDLLIVPLGIVLAVRLIPPPVMADLRARAIDQARPPSTAGLIAVVVLWLAAIAVAGWLLLAPVRGGGSRVW
jgi:hypothetical protein